MDYVIIIPAFNEERSISSVIRDIPPKYAQHIIVVNNGSTDNTGQVARGMSATVVEEKRRGYGQACLTGIAAAQQYQPDIYIFLDGDYSDYPEDIHILLDALERKKLDLVIGSRVKRAEKNALLPQARLGNWLATTLMQLRFGYRFTDLGPFRAIRSSALEQLQMCDTNFGWTVEMQIKALKLKLAVGEVPVRYRKRVGISKITGTISGTIRAGIKILWLIFRYAILPSSFPKRVG